MRPPWHFRAAKALIRRGIRGPGLWLRLAHRLGLLDRVVTYSLGGDLAVDVPLGRWENLWDEDEVRAYEARTLDRLADRLRGERPDGFGPSLLVDCGADIGLVPLLLAMRGVRFGRVIACEPNPQAIEVLRTNLLRLDARNEVHPQAVADFTGRGKLVRPDYDASEHAWHLARDDAGDVDVTTIDELLRGRPAIDGLVLKIDVEGGELAVIRGALETLRAAGRVTILLEAHAKVFRRTGIDPLEPVRAVAAIRPVEVHLAERPEAPVDLARPFFEQFPGEIAGNLLVESRKERL